jgi:carbonyl reductase 1
MERIAIVTGANRGIGLEICRQLARRGVRPVLTSRGEEDGRRAAADLEREGLRVAYHPLDVTDDESIRALAGWAIASHGGLDILVNNAGVAMDGFNAEVARVTIGINFFGPLHVTERLLPLIRRGGRIVMVSSGVADRSKLSRPLRAELEGDALTRDRLVELMKKFVSDVAAGTHTREGWPSSAYCVSKIGLNALTEILGRELVAEGRGILCNAACPGWVRTDMGGPHASRSVEEGADTPVWLALLPEGGSQGGFFRDRKPAAW